MPGRDATGVSAAHLLPPPPPSLGLDDFVAVSPSLESSVISYPGEPNFLNSPATTPSRDISSATRSSRFYLVDDHVQFLVSVCALRMLYIVH
jgi:hypothetical protein